MSSDRMEKLNLLWMDIEQGSIDAMAQLLRALHTHKGDASITGFASVAALTHALEDAVVVICATESPLPEDGDLYFEAVDLLGEIVSLDPDAESPECLAMIERLEKRTGRASTPVTDDSAQTTSEVADEAPLEAATNPKGSMRASDADNSLRVQAGQLDRMREIMGELMLARGRLDLSASRVRKERESAERDRASVAASQLARRLEKTLTNLESGLRDDVMHLSNLIEAMDSLTGDLRMIPIKQIFDRFPRHVRDLARDMGKRVGVSITGQEARLDREILSALDEPMLHLVRNAIDHGIETPEERVAAGKREMGTISLSTRLLGNSIEITVADDGSGIDIQKVREKARAKGLLTNENIDDHAALQTLLEPGMTTRTTVSEISGRGIGLDVVDTTVRKLKGELEIRSKLGEGTSFVISVPLSAAISTVVTFRVGRGTYALAAGAVESIERERDQVYVDSTEGKAVRFRDRTIPVINLDTRLGEPDKSNAAMLTRLIIARDGKNLYALAGAYEHAQREVVLKPAAGLLGQDDLVSAGCPLDNGDIALVLNISALPETSVVRSTDTDTTQLTALIADDSPIIRDLLSETLRSFGMEVIEAEDGADALLQLDKHGSADILVTDLDMPNIDGIELIKAIRRRPGPRMPAIVVSTRGSNADQMAAIGAGADAYLVKTSFTRDGLWSLVSKYLNL
jgi:chemotaxis protein histidine kinase CheA